MQKLSNYLGCQILKLLRNSLGGPLAKTFGGLVLEQSCLLTSLKCVLVYIRSV